MKKKSCFPSRMLIMCKTKQSISKVKDMLTKLKSGGKLKAVTTPTKRMQHLPALKCMFASLFMQFHVHLLAECLIPKYFCSERNYVLVLYQKHLDQSEITPIDIMG